MTWSFHGPEGGVVAPPPPPPPDVNLSWILRSLSSSALVWLFFLLEYLQSAVAVLLLNVASLAGRC